MSDSVRLGQRMARLQGAARVAAVKETVARWRASGQSKRAFCREVGVATVTLRRWLRELETGKALKSFDPVLVEVGVRAGGKREDGYKVVLVSGARLRVPVGFREEDLSPLINVLSSAC